MYCIIIKYLAAKIVEIKSVVKLSEMVSILEDEGVQDPSIIANAQKAFAGYKTELSEIIVIRDGYYSTKIEVHLD